MLKFFHINGYEIYIDTGIRLFNELRTEPYVDYLFSEKIIRIQKPPETKKKIYLDDHLLSPDYFNFLSKTPNENIFYVPMSQHPLMYHKGWWNEPIEEVVRKRSLFMAGNFDETAYAPIHQDRLFKIMSRIEVHLFLKKRNLIYDTKNLEELYNFIKGISDNKIILINRLDFDVPMNELRSILSTFNFFFALPGVVMPFTHNIVEAMSCGCIPFLQNEYAKMFSPPLIDGKHVIVFEDSANMEDRLNYLFSMGENEVQLMRNEVKIYYNNFLTPASVVKTIEETNFSKIYLQAEHYSVEILKSEQLN